MSEAAVGTAPSKAAPKQIAGFWRRTFALLIDCLVLAIPAYLLAQLAYDQLMALGQGGRLVGFVVTTLYFTFGDSAASGGQTIGKRLLGIRVVGTSGEPISLLRAFLRTLVFSIPVYLNGAYLRPELFPSEQLMWFGGAMLFLGVFGFGMASLYLFTFNTGTRQALHDLFLETYVVREENQAAIERRVWAGHLVVVLMMFVAVLGGPIYLQAGLSDTPLAVKLDDMTKLSQQLAANPEFDSVEVKTTAFSMYSTSVSKTTNYLEVIVRLKHRIDDTDAIIRDIARKVLSAHPDIFGQDELKITVRTGIDLGFLKLNNDNNDSRTAEEWRKILAEPKPGLAA